MKRFALLLVLAVVAATSLTAQPAFRKGENLVSAGRYDEALAHYEKACELLPSYARCHEKMEELLVKHGVTP